VLWRQSTPESDGLIVFLMGNFVLKICSERMSTAAFQLFANRQHMAYSTKDHSGGLIVLDFWISVNMLLSCLSRVLTDI
jgi:hypothetical protein